MWSTQSRVTSGDERDQGSYRYPSASAVPEQLSAVSEHWSREVIDVTTPRKTRVAVVFGGRSSEHAISCVSAGSILSALDPDQYDVVPVGITREGRWLLASGDPAQLSIADRRLPEITAASGSALVLPADPTAAGLMVLDPADGVSSLAGVDVVFPALHGAYGEDGTIQGMLEMAGIPYVGANVFASAAAMDKEFAKKLVAVEGIPVGAYAVLRAGCSLSEADKERLGLPVFVKPSRAGSSHGISKVSDWSELDAAVAAARQIDPKVLVEAAIVGREIECGVLEGEAGGAPEASLLSEIHVSGHDFFDFEAKYLEAGSYDIPADLPADVTRQVQEYARRAFTALDCAGLGRVDFFVTAANEIYLNEINTMPGFTPTSMFPLMWMATGLDYPKVVDRLIRTALRRGTGLH
jgi:D-alanine-D-alanine ligase